jgi:hypothetical protein
MMDSSYMATDAPPEKLTFLDTLHAAIAAEVKADLTGDIIDRVIAIVGTAIDNPQVNVTVNPVVDNITAPGVTVHNEMNMEDMCAKLDSIDHNLGVLIMLLSKPVTRTVTRENGYINSITERRL